MQNPRDRDNEGQRNPNAAANGVERSWQIADVPDLVSQIPSPLKNIIVVSVTMNGGMRRRTIASPFNAPMNIPTRSIATIPTGIARGLPARGPSSLVITAAPVMLQTATTEVRERSIPPVIKTTV
jgi:hypothetical protein